MDLTMFPEPKVAGAGGWEGTSATQSCPSGEVAIGLNGRADDRLRRIGLICANAEHWSRADVTPNVVPGNPLGSSTAGTSFDVRCDRGDFIAGWTVRTGKWDVTRVTFIAPVCRNFGDKHRCDPPCMRNLRVTVSGQGRVTGIPTFNCGPEQTCNAPIGSGTKVTLFAVPDSGSNFNGWTGCPTVDNNKCIIDPMIVDRVLTATFTTPACSFTQCKSACVVQCRAEGGTTTQCNSECSAVCAECT
jgi:hypothetical protein